LPRNWSVMLWGAEQAAYFHLRSRAIVDQALWALELFSPPTNIIRTVALSHNRSCCTICLGL
jgi:hypothetical protein